MLANFFREIRQLVRPYLIIENCNYFLVLVALVLGIYLRWDRTIVAFITVLTYIFLFPVRTKLLLQGAIGCLIIAGCCILVGRSDYANILTLLSYFLLVVAFLTSYYEYRWGKK